VLWQASFHNLTCSLGTHLNADQVRRRCNRPRTVYLTFDVDVNQSGQHAAMQGSEWFLMWQSKMWNGQEEAFRMFAIVGVVFLVVVQREPTPD
jgi:predicted small integral membrane protein